MVYIFPNEIYQQNHFVPIPLLDVTLDTSEMKLGESFILNIVSTNVGDTADIQITSIAFPNVQNITDIIKITNYDFTHSPRYVNVGDKIGAKYSGGKDIVIAEYPSIEAYSRPMQNGTSNFFSVKVTPQSSGIFNVYVKAIGIPHFNNESHYPQDGIPDHQSELVDVYSITVNP